ncbi:LOW QUALITY PROTEIN: cell adhesion molecule CEACAM8-like [Molossus nigricans]
MGYLSTPSCRGRGPWQGLLLAVSLFTWSPPITQQLTVVSIDATVGEDVLFHARNLPGDLVGYNWFKGESIENENRSIASYVINTQSTTLGPASSGRETIYPNGSLLFQKVTQEDTGYYTLQAIKRNLRGEKGTGRLRVYPELLTPNITTNNSNPEENKDPVVLTCEPWTQNTTYLWLINSQSLPDSTRLQLSNDNRTLTLLHVTRNDTGPYVCESRNPVSAGRSDPFTLNVLYGPDAPVISPPDSHYPPGANLNLSCHAASNPPTQYSWSISGSPPQPTQKLFIPNITANDSGSYTCLAHNPHTGLSRTAVKMITVSEPMGKPSIQARNRVTEHKDTVVLTCLTNDTGISIRWLFNKQSLWFTDRMKLSQGNSTLTIDPVRREDGGSYQCEVSNPFSSSKSDPLWLDVQYVSASQHPVLSDGAIAGIVIGGLLVVVLGTSLGYFLYQRRTRKASDPRGLREHPPPASTPGQGPSGTSAIQGPPPGSRTAGPIYQELLHPNTDVYCRINPTADGTS